MRSHLHTTFDNLMARAASPSCLAAHAKIRLFAGIAINVAGAIVLFSESFRFLNSSL